MKASIVLLLPLALWLGSCGPDGPKRLPVLGEHQVSAAGDTIYYTLPPFRFRNQDSAEVTAATFAGKVYVADFFFTTCPDICPKMKDQMLRVYERFGANDSVLLLSHTINPRHDTVGVLREFSQALGISSAKWHMVTGDPDSIFYMARQYMISAMPDEQAPGGFLHSGAFILVDPAGRIRGYYDGTDPEKVDELMRDIPILLHEARPQ
ncbi:MAG: SCO family protein [Bacteroidia bacterium]|nr:SCO family protein [Bacteroidia bacterium]